MRFKAVIFDCDGVLIDSEPIACAADAEALTAAGFPISTAEIQRRFTGVPTPDMLAAIEAEHGRRPPAAVFAEVQRAVIRRFQTELQALPGAGETVDALRAAGLALAVGSSGAPAKVAAGLVATELYERFYPYIYCARLVARGKPAPDLFLHAATALGVAPADCLVVEDSVAGAQAARAAGMACVGFTGGGHATEDLAARLASEGAAPVIDRLSALPAIVAGASF